jgi:unsaturated rhamnogalacturonyl hydrolase
MKKSKFIIVSVLILFSVGLSNLSYAKEKKPSKKEILETLNKVNDYLMKKWSDPTMPTEKNLILKEGAYRKSLHWTRGAYFAGFMELYKITKDPRLLDYAVEWGDKHNWSINRGTQTRNANDHSAGLAYVELYNIDPTKKERLAKIKKSIDLVIESDDVEDWNWVDAAFMAMPTFAILGATTGDEVYYTRMHNLFMAMKDDIGGGLYNEKDGLWWRDADFKPPYKEPNGNDCYWSRGNGWVIGALAKTLDIMPDDAPNRKVYEKIVKEMCESLLKVQREDGMWNVSLFDPNHFGGKELTGTAFFVYGMSWAVNNGLLDAKKYKPAIFKAWNTMVNECVRPDGSLAYIQGTGKEPKDSQPVTYDSVPDYEDYGIGIFLLAGSEVYKMR